MSSVLCECQTVGNEFGVGRTDPDGFWSGRQGHAMGVDDAQGYRRAWCSSDVGRGHLLEVFGVGDAGVGGAKPLEIQAFVDIDDGCGIVGGNGPLGIGGRRSITLSVNDGGEALGFVAVGISDASGRYSVGPAHELSEGCIESGD